MSAQEVALAINELTKSFETSITDPAEKAAFAPILETLFAADSVPASAKVSTHGGFDGGLIVHKHRVHKLMGFLAGGLLNGISLLNVSAHPLIQGEPEDFSREIERLNPGSIFKVALLHDLNKLRTLDGQPYYVPNILKGGKRSDKVPWERHETAEYPLSHIHGIIQQFGGRPTEGSAWDALLGIVLTSKEGIQIREGLISLGVAASLSPQALGYLSPEEKSAIIFHDGAYAGKTGLTGKETMLQILLHSADMLASRFFC